MLGIYEKEGFVYLHNYTLVRKSRKRFLYSLNVRPLRKIEDYMTS